YQLSVISSPEDFLNETKVKNFSYEFLKDAPNNASLEGFLFPDTYFVPKDITAHDLIDLMLTNFDKKFDGQLREDLQKQNLNIFEAIVFASIVEREAKKEEDRPLVGGILVKRQKNGWPLEADATVQYAVTGQLVTTNHQPPTANQLDWWPQELTKEDLQIDSPYNTRKFTGLPPGPIANPGLASIKAVVYPKESEYWYYVSDEAGNIYYSQTFEEHQAKIAKYVR
ncbi:MAG: endolytic transglycosylase MltG, partial [Candidatus Cloacimonetes bacterium]|nr:endolytic transglycosylase MltG [Candidatus Cloacimonadota bacterium]